MKKEIYTSYSHTLVYLPLKEIKEKAWIYEYIFVYLHTYRTIQFRL